jgi:L-threonylcarbamoyladenylate synthase
MSPCPQNNRRFSVDPQHPPAHAVLAAAEALRAGHLVIIPTDTVYGIAADPEVPGAVDRIFRAKDRPQDKEIPLLADSLERVRQYGAHFTPAALRLANAFWPGPLTLVLPVGHTFKAFRIPNYTVTTAVIAAANRVLAVTSANRSGAAPALTADDAMRYFADCEDVALCLDAGRSPGGVPSTVVRVRENELELIREGAIPFSRLNELAG